MCANKPAAGLAAAQLRETLHPSGEDEWRNFPKVSSGVRINRQFFAAVRGDDFVGVQTYSRTRVGERGPLQPAPGVEVTQMGYEFYPEALEATIRNAWADSGCAILVTENGIGTEDDAGESSTPNVRCAACSAA